MSEREHVGSEDSRRRENSMSSAPSVVYSIKELKTNGIGACIGSANQR